MIFGCWYAGWDSVCWSTVWAVKNLCWRISGFLICQMRSSLWWTDFFPPSLLSRSVFAKEAKKKVNFLNWRSSYQCGLWLMLFQILNALTCEVLEHQGSFRSPSDQVQFITQSLKDSKCARESFIQNCCWTLVSYIEHFLRSRPSCVLVNPQHWRADAARREDPECTGAAGIRAQPALGGFHRPHQCSVRSVLLRIRFAVLIVWPWI